MKKRTLKSEPIKLTPAQRRMLRRTAETGTCDIDDERQHGTRLRLDKTGIIVYDQAVGAYVLTKEGAALARELWPDIEPVELGDPFAGDNCGIEPLVVEAYQRWHKTGEAYTVSTAPSDRERREAQIKARIELFLMKLDCYQRLEVTRTIAPAGAGFHVIVELQGKHARATSQDALTIRRQAIVRDEGELNKLLFLVGESMRHLATPVRVGGEPEERP